MTVLVHIVCGTMVEIRDRTIVSLPEDPTWPVDFSYRLPYCPTCRQYPSFEEVKEVRHDA